MSTDDRDVLIRGTRRDDFEGIIGLTREVYRGSQPWNTEQLASHLEVFPGGQFVAVEAATGVIVGMAASLIVLWDDYDVTDSWRDFTASGMFTNHDPENGRTLYGAEVMVLPERRRLGIGRKLYAARRSLVERLGLLRIRAGARLRGYHSYADRLSAQDYVTRVQRGEIADPTLNFQLGQGFTILAVVPGYLRNDSESLGWAAVIEWLNPNIVPLDAST
ncbi:MAG TPA: GNAT family N-acetyltransferase [Gemmatimonadaceae bacterium]|nr:GNAT family N-acetyltransferase [Gemmatimonadaceae bacterium]